MNLLLTGTFPRRRVVERIKLRRAAQTRTIEGTTTATRCRVVDGVVPTSAFYERAGVERPHGAAGAGIGVKCVPRAASDVWTDGSRRRGLSWLAPDEIWWDGEVRGEENAGAEFAGAFFRCAVVLDVVEEVAGLVWALGWVGLFAATDIEDLVPDWD
jgi:hypothetical protein